MVSRGWSLVRWWCLIGVVFRGSGLTQCAPSRAWSHGNRMSYLKTVVPDDDGMVILFDGLMRFFMVMVS